MVGSFEIEADQGVVKRGKLGKNGQRVLRLIMNFVPTNSLQASLDGDIEQLTGAMAWLSLVLEDDVILVFYGDDLVCSFYLFELPDEWLGFFAFSRPVPHYVLYGGTCADEV